MNAFYLLADEAAPLNDVPRRWPHQGDFLNYCQHMAPEIAMLLIIAGLVYLLWGYKIFKMLVLLNAAVFGGYIGASMTHGGEPAAAAAVIGAVFAGAVAWPTMKYAVALMGGVFGAILGAGIWHGAGLDENLLWAGALSGLIALGMLSFILFRGSVMVYTSLQGSAMMVFGILGLIYKYQEIGPRLTDHLHMEPFLLPAFVFIPACVGWVYQHHNTVGAGAGGGGGGGGGKKAH
jgi:hypothetical protein